MKAKLGIAPIAWSNDDLPELGGNTSLETCLSEARMAGFTGIETGGKFPQDPAVLGPILKAHDIRLCGGWYSGAEDEMLSVLDLTDVVPSDPPQAAMATATIAAEANDRTWLAPPQR